MIPVTPRMARVHAELWRLTHAGTDEWTGTVKLDGISGPSVHDALYWLRRRKAINWRHAGIRNNHRTFWVEVGPGGLAVTVARPRQVAHVLDGSASLTDSSAFSRAFERAHPGGRFG